VKNVTLQLTGWKRERGGGIESIKKNSWTEATRAAAIDEMKQKPEKV